MKKNKITFWSFGIGVAIIAIFLVSVFGFDAGLIGLKKNLSDNNQVAILKKYWKYQRDGDCSQADKLTTEFAGYDKDSNGQIIIPPKIVVTVNGQKTDSVRERSLCKSMSSLTMMRAEIRKVISLEEEPELQKTKVKIYVADDTIFKVEYIVLLTKENEGSDWKIYSITSDKIIE